jgi:hypothetical protein
MYVCRWDSPFHLLSSDGVQDRRQGRSEEVLSTPRDDEVGRHRERARRATGIETADGSGSTLVSADDGVKAGAGFAEAVETRTVST